MKKNKTNREKIIIEEFDRHFRGDYDPHKEIKYGKLFNAFIEGLKEKMNGKENDKMKAKQSENHENNNPKCCICKWCRLIMFDICCGAQGYKKASEMFNNEYCKTIYKEESGKGKRNE